MTKQYTPQEILSLPIEASIYSEEMNVGQYLMLVLSAYYDNNRSFNVNAPLGVAAWKVPIRDAFRKAGLIDEESFDTDAGMAKVFGLLHTADWKTLTEYKEPEDWYVVLLDTNSIGNPVLSDSFAIGFTEKEAKAKVDTRKLTHPHRNWVAIQIPK